MKGVINILLVIMIVNVVNGISIIKSRSLSMSLSSIPSLSSISSISSQITNSNMYNMLSSMPLADTSISEDEILDITGTASNLPDPLYTIGLAVVILIGTLILQFSLGDLTKEEGQARVRDFLQTRRETERRRGYFDSPGERKERPTDEI
jgi:hypothetical protein